MIKCVDLWMKNMAPYITQKYVKKNGNTSENKQELSNIV